MAESYTEVLLRKYPYLKDLSERFIFTTKEDIDELCCGEKIKIENEKLSHNPMCAVLLNPMSVELLKRILQDEMYYQYAYKCIVGDIDEFKVCSVFEGDIAKIIRYNRVQLVKGLEILVQTGQIELQGEEKKHYDTLRNYLLLENFLAINKNKDFKVSIEGNEYFIPIRQIFELMYLPQEEFDELCTSTNGIFGIPKEYFMYATYQYFVRNKLLSNLLLDDSIFDRFDDIKSQQKVDFQAINKFLETTDTVFKEANINQELLSAILNGMPSDASDLEKALYIYIKMCKTLTYDDEYFAVNQRGKATLKHKDINYISTITPDNNKVVCFEFNLIYSKFLNDLGIKFASNYKGNIDESYGDGHVDLEFRSGKFLVYADSVTSILYGDITRAKLNEPLVGLQCVNFNKRTRREFEQSLSRMYEVIAREEKQQEDVSVEHVQTFDELMEEYASITSNITPIDLDEKVSILMNKINLAGMVGIDSLSYALHLRKILFTEKERLNNVIISVVRNNEPIDQDRIAMAGAIFTVNSVGFFDEPDKNKYYYFNSSDGFVPVSREELQMRFDEKTFEYIEEKDPRVPGIKEGGVENVRKATTY